MLAFVFISGAISSLILPPESFQTIRNGIISGINAIVDYNTTRTSPLQVPRNVVTSIVGRTMDECEALYPQYTFRKYNQSAVDPSFQFNRINVGLSDTQRVNCVFDTFF